MRPIYPLGKHCHNWLQAWLTYTSHRSFSYIQHFVHIFKAYVFMVEVHLTEYYISGKVTVKQVSLIAVLEVISVIWCYYRISPKQAFPAGKQNIPRWSNILSSQFFVFGGINVYLERLFAYMHCTHTSTYMYFMIATRANYKNWTPLVKYCTNK